MPHLFFRYPYFKKFLSSSRYLISLWSLVLDRITEVKEIEMIEELFEV